MTNDAKFTPGASDPDTTSKPGSAKNRRLPVRKGWLWTATRERAAQLVAGGELSSAEIGQRIHVSDRTVDSWRKTPEFRERVEEHLARYRELFLKEGLADKARRVAKLSKWLAQLEAEIESRAADFQRRGLKHGSTGLVSETVKRIGTGDSAEQISEFTIDNAVVARMQSLLEQIAKELGQWQDKKGPEVNVAVTVQQSPVNLNVLSVDELRTLEQLARKARIIDADPAITGQQELP